FFVLEVDLGVDSEAADNAGDGITCHLAELAGAALNVGRLRDARCHSHSLFRVQFIASQGFSPYRVTARERAGAPAPTRCGSLRFRVSYRDGATSALCRAGVR